MNPDTLATTATATACIAMLGAAAWCDARTRRIPNSLVLGGSIAGLGIAMLPSGIGADNALLGLGIGLAALLPFYLARAMGAGDVKLMAAAGTFVGYPGVIIIILWALLAGGILSLAGMLYRRPQRAARQVDADATNPSTDAWRVPYAVAIAIGTTAYFIVSSRLLPSSIF
jgi:prepilin peptidase CpaA